MVRFKCSSLYLLLSLFSFLLLLVWTVLLVSVIKDRAMPLLRRRQEMFRKNYDVNYNLPSYQMSIARYREKIPGLMYESVRLDALNHSDPRVSFFPLSELLGQWNPNDVDESKWPASPAHPDRGKGIPRLDFSDKQQLIIARR